MKFDYKGATVPHLTLYSEVLLANKPTDVVIHVRDPKQDGEGGTHVFASQPKAHEERLNHSFTARSRDAFGASRVLCFSNDALEQHAGESESCILA